MLHNFEEKEKQILNILFDNGYEAMVVGGAVRDHLLGKNFNDVDIATNAPYEKLVELMKDVGTLKFTGGTFGVLLVSGIEVATYRTDNYEDNQVIVQHALNAYEDSKRRDFTVNAIYYDASNDKLVDYHEGINDLINSILKAVGNPWERFSEDYSRILRALYLSAYLDFEIEENTGLAIKDLAHNVSKIPGALQGKIVLKTIEKNVFSKFLKLLKEYDVLQYIFPEVIHMIGMPQNPKYHKYDVWNHVVAVVEAAEKNHESNVSMIMGAFLHDIAKGTEGVRGISNSGQFNDIGHEKAGVPIAKKICSRLELSKQIKNEVVMIVRWHGNRFGHNKKGVKKFLLRFKNEFRNVEQLKNGFTFISDFMLCDAAGFAEELKQEIISNVESAKINSIVVFEEQVFYSKQFEFQAKIIFEHKNVEANQVADWIEFFIKNNVKTETQAIKLMNKGAQLS